MLEAVKQWAFTLVITAAAGGIASFFTISREASDGMKRYVKFACAVIALAVMIMPMREMFRETPELFAPDFNADAYYQDEINNINIINELTEAKTIELIKMRISDIVYEKTGIKPDEIRIYIEYTENKDYYSIEIEIDKIEIVMREPEIPGGVNYTEELKLYLNRLFDCETVLNINLRG
ncbi:MAG: hypothetical protein FWH10_07085 [Oscillospiraceae bacterium]|nr:hypothetical protein [Oscillospiraceae bacterium]